MCYLRDHDRVACQEELAFRAESSALVTNLSIDLGRWKVSTGNDSDRREEIYLFECAGVVHLPVLAMGLASSGEQVKVGPSLCTHLM